MVILMYNMCHNTHHIIYIAIDQNHKDYDEPWAMAYYCWRKRPCCVVVVDYDLHFSCFILGPS